MAYMKKVTLEVEVEYKVRPKRSATFEQPSEGGVEITNVFLHQFNGLEYLGCVDITDSIDSETIRQWEDEIEQDLEDK